MKELKQEYEGREADLKDVLESKLVAKNTEVANIMTKLKKETEDLIDKHSKRLRALEKEYNELKKVLGQKTSLPEDI